MLYLLLFPLVVIGGLLIFLAPMFSRLIAKDYELGLVRLRAVLDPSAPKLDIRFPGITEMPGKRPAKYIFRRPRRIRTMVPCSTPGGRATWHDDDGPQSTGEGLSRAGRPAA
jgi:hypothetical protein